MNGTVYGALYNWGAIKTGNLCPKGWHIPSSKDWWKLLEYSGFKNLLKKQGGVEETRVFNALPGGYRSKGNFFGKDKCTYFWASEKEGEFYLTGFTTYQPKPNFAEASMAQISTDFDPCFFYVRCVQDNN